MRSVGPGWAPVVRARVEHPPRRAGWRAALLALLCAAPLMAVAERSDSEKAGDALAVLVPVAAFALTLHEDDRRGTLELARSIGVSALATYGLKELSDKTRPDGECCDSFPSAHASAAFSGAAFIHRRYGFRRALPAYLVATFVGYSRVDADKHFTEDVIAGAAVGILSSWFLTTRLQNTVIIPVASQGHYGVKLIGRF